MTKREQSGRLGQARKEEGTAIERLGPNDTSLDDISRGKSGVLPELTTSTYDALEADLYSYS